MNCKKIPAVAFGVLVGVLLGRSAVYLYLRENARHAREENGFHDEVLRVSPHLLPRVNGAQREHRDLESRLTNLRAEATRAQLRKKTPPGARA